MKYIFLDIDGVLNCGTGVYSFLHKDKVELLTKIVKETNARIILISSWKDEWFKDETGLNGAHAKILNNVFAEFGIEISDKTNDNNSWKRGKGIVDYLNNHPAESWIVLDDDIFPDYKECGCIEHLIKTGFNTGLTENLCKKAIQMLNNAQTY